MESRILLKMFFMKVVKCLYSLLVPVLFVALCVSCSDDDEVLTENPSDIEFALFCLDEEGNNMLNDKEYLNKISIDLGSQIFVPRSEKEIGLSSSTINLVYKESAGGNITLTLGKFLGTVKQDRTFTINWGDGTSDEVRFVNVAEKKSGGYKLTRNYYLNGEPIDNPIIYHTINCKLSAYGSVENSRPSQYFLLRMCAFSLCR